MHDSNPYTFKVHQASVFKEQVQVFEADGTTPRSLADVTVSGTVKYELSDSTALFTFTISDKDDANGKFVLNLSAAQMASIEIEGFKTSLVFDVIFDYDLTSEKYSWLNGYIVVVASVS